MAIALLNLNMVLSLKPKHFLALVYRGRIYSLEGQYNLASRDFLQANKINQYRFTHFGLYREYIKTVNHEVGSLGNSINRNFNQVFEVLRKVQDKTAPETDGDDRLDNLEMLGSIESDLEGEDIYLVDELGFERKDEREKFRRLGPITQKEIDDINWNNLIKKLSS